MNAYRLQRMTFDVDFVIKEEDLCKIEPEILDKGYTVFNKTAAFIQYKGVLQGLRDIDFIFVGEKTLNNLLSHGKTVHFAGTSLIVPSAVHLITMKLHAIRSNPQRRMKDVPDIVFLMNSGNIDPHEESVRLLFEKYGAEDLYHNIIEGKQ